MKLQVVTIDELSGEPKVIGEIDRDFSQSGSNTIALSDMAGRQLQALLGQGCGDVNFNLVDGALTFFGCRVASNRIDFVRVVTTAK